MNGLSPALEALRREYVRRNIPIQTEDWSPRRGTSDIPSKGELRRESGRAGRKSHGGKWRTRAKGSDLFVL